MIYKGLLIKAYAVSMLETLLEDTTALVSTPYALSLQEEAEEHESSRTLHVL
jgi:hypothetical protein